MKGKIIKQEKGITLIALVITIIVLLILAGVAISMLSGENGILTRASEAKTQTEDKSEEEQVKLAATEAMMLSTDYTVKYKELTETLNGQLGAGTYTITPTEDAEAWEIVVTKTKNHYTVTGSGTAKYLTWYYTEDGTQITNGKQTLTLGDEVKYDPTAGLTANEENGVYKEYKSESTKNGNSDQEFKLTNNEGQKLEWRVLGIDDDGNVLIMPTECIKDENGLIQYFTLSGKKGAQYGVEELNNIAAIYGHGTGAQSARSIKEEDIVKIINPTLSSGTNRDDYGTKVTYEWISDGSIKWSWTDKNGDIHTGEDSGYIEYLEGNTWKQLSSTNKKVTLVSTNRSCSIEKSSCKTQELYDLLTKNTSTASDSTDEESNYYWLASMFQIPYANTWFTGISALYDEMIDDSELYLNSGLEYSLGVRPAVSLKSDISFGGNEQDGWTISQ